MPGRSVFLALSLLLAAPAAGQPVERVPYEPLLSELAARIDFETFPRLIYPGTPLDHVLDFPGAQIGERFAGQALAQSGGFDRLGAFPLPPLRVAAGVPGQNLNVSFIYYFSNQLSGVAPPGHPERRANGEGAIAILFENDQYAVGFIATSEPEPAEPGAEPGRMQVAFFRRDGTLIDTLDIALDWSRAGYGFRRADGTRDIAGIAITNRDPEGIAIDDVIYDPAEVIGWLIGDRVQPN